MFNQNGDQCVRMETTCVFLLQEMQKIWDEVGEPDAERDTMLQEIEQECLEVYKSKIDEAKKYRAQMQQEIAKFQTEFADICYAMGEQPPHFDQNTVGGLENELKAIISQLEDMRKRKIERKNHFFEILGQLEKISKEICKSVDDSLYKMVVEETDLSLKRLEELRAQLVEYQDEKKNRLKQIIDYLSTLNSLCLVLGIDFKHTIYEIHPTLEDSEGSKDTSNDTIRSLANVVSRLREVKSQRWQKLQALATSLLELWNLIDIPTEEQKIFQNFARKTVASVSEVTETNMLSIDFLNNVESEVSRLEHLKLSKMKELILKRWLELENVCRRAHMSTEAFGAMFSIEDIESRITSTLFINVKDCCGTIDPTCLLEQCELQIVKVKEEALSRKELLAKVEKWLAACQEECWFEEYNKDESRYNAGRGAHLTLKRAEMARSVVNKIPAMVEVLILKTKAWEKEKGVEFLYDNDQKRLQGQLVTEHEVLYGSKVCPSKSGKKAFRSLMGVAINKNLSLGGQMLQNSKPEKAAPNMHPSKKGDLFNQKISPLQCGGFATPSPGKYSQMPRHSDKKHSSSAARTYQIEPELIRKPLSPVSSRLSSKANITNFLEDQIKRPQDPKMQRKLPSSSEKPLATPSKPVIVSDDENRTPRTMPIPVPTTPPTLSVTMLTVKTPTTPRGYSGACPVDESDEPVEYSFEGLRAGWGYSFEEVRAGFVRPKTYGHDLNLTN